MTMTLEASARQLAKNHTISRRPPRKTPLIDRLRNQEEFLHRAYQHFTQASEAHTALSYAGEWLLDNYYVVQQAIRQTREDMPPEFYRQLPKLGSLPRAGYPRVFDLAWRIIGISRYRIDIHPLTRFIQAYQQVVPLTMGELWAFPTMLRLVILESLTRLVAQTLEIQDENQEEEDVAFKNPASPLADETDIAGCILSLRILATQDWKTFVEDVSRVEQVLRSDPTGIYSKMDFETRDSYRKVIEILAQATGKEEEAVAQDAIWLAESTLQHGGEESPRTSHVGFYLLDSGRTILEDHLDYHPPWNVRWHRWILNHPMPIYLVLIGLFTALIVLAVVGYAYLSAGTLNQLIIAGLLFLIPAMSVSVYSVHWLVTHAMPPQVLPRLDFQEKVPAEYRTMVVVPSLATDADEVESLLHQLEIHYLSNADPYLHFALLTDFADAPQKQMPEDETLLESLKTGIQDLNQKYTQGASSPFFLFHRERQWNPGEECWMGWERKRGKLAEFNRLLADCEATSYYVQMGNLKILSEINYVITVDADTVLPRDSASHLIAIFAHPLNRAEFDPESGEIFAGYTLLQPRVEIKPASVNQSLFTRVFAGDATLDLYTRAVSDVYQDLFGEGNYTGKGIYDVAAFKRSLAGKVPENALLSHDLFEGLHGRVGLVTDVVVLEDYPPHYLSNERRWHRWVRGDWQLLPWLMPRAPSANGEKIVNPFSTLDRWKVFDNMRRSLMMPSVLACLLMGWLWLPGSASMWTLLSVFLLGIPLLTGTITAVTRKLLQHVSGDWFQIGRSALRWLFSLIFLPYQTLITLDAIGTVLLRMTITHKRLLQWTTSAHTLRFFGKEMKVRVFWEQMMGMPLFAVLVTFLLVGVHRAALPVAGVFLLAWLVAPQIAYWISRPIIHRTASISSDQQGQLRGLARRTWFYFEHFVGPDDHWLPPDHFQEDPRGLVAHRTSPTNIGLFLLSTLAAYNLGYIGPVDLALRLGNTLGEMEKLQRYRGHFLNWYDTRNLDQLSPPYVSTVDSGNLAGCLLALKQGCLALPQDALLRWQRWQGLLDTLMILETNVEELRKSDTEDNTASLKNYLADMRQKILSVQNTPAQWVALLDYYCNEGWDKFKQLLLIFIESVPPTVDAVALQELRVWQERAHHHLLGAQRELSLLMPWLLPLRQPPTGLLAQVDINPILAKVWGALQDALPMALQLDQVQIAYRKSQNLIEQMEEILEDQESLDWCAHLVEILDSARMSAQALLIGYRNLSDQIEDLFQAMDFRFLFDPQRQVFHLGYNAAIEKVDGNHYDLLASEARLASLVAIARGDVPKSHWLHLSRPMTQVGGMQAMLSWNGSMFEYLMPPLLMHSYPDTSLSQTHRAVVQRQIDYGRQKNVPWGVSEAGYYSFDAHMNYQYRGFGVPGLGFKRGLSEDLVIAPYASLLALSIQPQAVMKNIANLERLHMVGLYGFYEAVDYTESRLPLGQEYGIVRSYYAHHQGMILLALDNYLQDKVMISRFHTAPRVESVELLLQERIPRQAPIETPHPEEIGILPPDKPHPTAAIWQVPVATPLPQVHCLSNGRYRTLISNAGGGYSSWREITLTRWHPDATLDNWGTWVYAQDLESGNLWSAGFQPVASQPENLEVLFSPHKVEFQRRDYDVSLRMELTVAPEDDVEIRRLTLINHSSRPRRLRLTSYGEVVLSLPSADLQHPAYNKLFIESEYLPELNALLFWRRPRSADESPVYLVHLLVSEQENENANRYETRRANFIGRGGTFRSPATFDKSGLGLTDFAGAPLDPVMVLGKDIDLAPQRTVKSFHLNLLAEQRAATKVAFITLAAESRQDALDLAQRYRDWHRIDETFDQARFFSERELNQLNLTTREIKRYQQILSSLLYPYSALRADTSILATNQKGQEGLWSYAISGDYPILLVRIDNQEDIALVSDILRAHAYWRKRGIQIDLAILNLQDTGYSQELHNRLYQLLHRGGDDVWLNRRGGIFVLRADSMNSAQRTLLETAARLLLDARQGGLADQLRVLQRQPTRLPSFTATLTPPEDEQPVPPVMRPENLLFDNGLGGFSPDGREYVIYLKPGRHTPNPWINVIANPKFGFTVSESGSGYTWALNSGENRLTPWQNDPVTDRPGEAIYLREEEVGRFWSPTPLPSGGNAPYLIRHGIGYSIFEHNSHGLKQHLRFFAAPDAPVKIVQLRLENTWDRTRRVTATYYAEWVLGTTREEMAPYIIPEFDTSCHTLLAHNPYHTEFGKRTAFLTSTREPHGLTTDRTEFLGRMGSYRHPAALGRVGLSATIDAGLDSCAAMQILLWLAPGETKEVTFLLGQGADREDALRLARQYQKIDSIEAAWQAVTQRWGGILDSIQVNTPEPAMNLLLNRWLLYQTLACRVWGRSALYQSSGAFGFRDQLQDVMALMNVAPKITRAQILDAASHQFEEGDVLHWWHPPSGRGVRTRCSDDLLWLPYVTALYVKATGDASILGEEIPFLEGQPLQEDEMEHYGLYETSTTAITLHEHCRRALAKGDTAGAHGLPLIGSHDWNDGLNRIGLKGRGESVWLGWFLQTTLTHYAKLCVLMNNEEQAAEYQRRAEELRQAIEAHAWDGKWYRRAYDDDGIPLGSAGNLEYQISSLPQSWAVLSGAGDAARAEQAMEAVAEQLVKPDDQIILLFAPPFDKTKRDPGYIRGYLPGIRENGGQYTHAALWAVWAFARLGQGDRAESLFRLLNPIYHADTPEKASRYRIEPYVVAADIYSMHPHIGHGGWSWYTGSAGWMYRLGVEGLLGFQRTGDILQINPCIPKDWKGYELTYHNGDANYHICVKNPHGVNQGVKQVLLDGKLLPQKEIPIQNDAQFHEVIVVMGRLS